MLLVRLQRDKWQVGERSVRRILRKMKRTQSIGRVITTDSKQVHPRFPNLIQAYPIKTINHLTLLEQLAKT
jgi:hypothetical protein